MGRPADKSLGRSEEAGRHEQSNAVNTRWSFVWRVIEG
jgi:hypothetical protein